MVIDIKRANKKLMASNHSAMTSTINMIINLYHQGPGDRFATDFGGMRPLLSQYKASVATSRKEKHEKSWNQFIIVIILQCQSVKRTQ